jgi:hypothetical protein
MSEVEDRLSRRRLLRNAAVIVGICGSTGIDARLRPATATNSRSRGTTSTGAPADGATSTATAAPVCQTEQGGCSLPRSPERTAAMRGLRSFSSAK